jgi:hypothetical protein
MSLARPRIITNRTRRFIWGLKRFDRNRREAPAQAELRPTAQGGFNLA